MPEKISGWQPVSHRLTGKKYPRRPYFPFHTPPGLSISEYPEGIRNHFATRSQDPGYLIIAYP